VSISAGNGDASALPSPSPSISARAPPLVNASIRQGGEPLVESAAVVRRPTERTRRASRIVALATAAAFVLTLGSTPAEASTYRHRALELVNAARLAHDVDPVRINLSLSKVAKDHTRKMIRQGRLEDVSDLTRVLSPYRWKMGGAIVGCGGSLAQIHRAFLGDETHRNILLSREARRVGIGVVRARGKSPCGRNAFWITEIFYG
jgi:uncharacterized protein YkwD